MSKTIKFNAPKHHVLVLPSGKSINGGQKATVPDEVALELTTAPYTDVTIARPVRPRTQEKITPKPAEKKDNKPKGVKIDGKRTDKNPSSAI